MPCQAQAIASTDCFRPETGTILLDCLREGQKYQVSRAKGRCEELQLWINGSATNASQVVIASEKLAPGSSTFGLGIIGLRFPPNVQFAVVRADA
eukprot:Skav205710  [mRNA]  locus=scaffold608:32193:33411:+ [translate_table: standard]